MNDKKENILESLKKALAGGGNAKVLRFLLNCLSGTPYIGGVFGAGASAWSESDQKRINELLALFVAVSDERITTLENSLVDSCNPQHVIVGFITFNPNVPEFIDSSGIVALTDNGPLDFTVSFSQPHENYVFNYYGSGKVVLREAQETRNGIRLVFEEPCPDRITIVFIERQPNQRIKTDSQ